MNAFLLEVAWKSGCVASAALIVVRLLRVARPADRVNILRVAAAVLLMLPFAIVFGPRVPIVLNASVTSDVVQGKATHAAVGLLQGLYFMGLSMAIGRIAFSLLALARWTSRACLLSSTGWREAVSRLRRRNPLARRVRILESDAICSPVSWGWLRPVILVDGRSAARAGNADAILAHEMAHIQRLDWVFLMALHLVTALFWFNPLVWFLKSEAFQCMEEAADAEAVEIVGAVPLAEALLNAANSQRPAVSAINIVGEKRRHLARRIRLLLQAPERHAAPLWAAGAMSASVLLAALVASTEFVAASPAVAALRQPLALNAALPPHYLVRRDTHALRHGSRFERNAVADDGVAASPRSPNDVAQIARGAHGMARDARAMGQLARAWSGQLGTRASVKLIPLGPAT